VPWFVALFGRDSLITALQTLLYDPRIAANTLKLLAKYQGRRDDQQTREEPGRILHELRVGEMANLHEVLYTPYYGSVDATPLFIVLLGEYVRWTGDRGLWRQLKGNTVRALDWIDRSRDHGLGFTSYDTDTNMGWKDSGNCIVRSDGSLAEPPIALVEVQGYVYWAKLQAAFLFELDNEVDIASRLRREAEELRLKFNRAFWLRGRTILRPGSREWGQARRSGELQSRSGASHRDCQSPACRSSVANADERPALQWLGRSHLGQQ